MKDIAEHSYECAWVVVRYEVAEEMTPVERGREM